MKDRKGRLGIEGPTGDGWARAAHRPAVRVFYGRVSKDLVETVSAFVAAVAKAGRDGIRKEIEKAPAR